MAVRADQARRRPEILRYFYLAEGDETIHVGTTLGALQYAVQRHGVHSLYLADIVTGRVERVQEPIADFMRRWRQHYDDPAWDYFVPQRPADAAPLAPAEPLPHVRADQAGWNAPAEPGPASADLEAVIAAAVRETLRRLGR